MNKLKLGIVLDTTEVNLHVQNLLLWVGAQDSLEISSIVIYEPIAQRRAAAERPARILKQAKYAMSRAFLTAAVTLEKQLLKMFDGHEMHLETVNLEHTSFRDKITYVSSCDSQERRLNAAATLLSKGLDLMVQIGAAKLDQEVLHAADLGVIKLDYHGNHTSSSAPPGFWESYHKLNETRFSIVKLNEPGMAEQVLLHGSYPTKFFLSLNQSNLFTKSTAQLKSLILTIASARQLPRGKETLPYSGPFFDYPNPLQALIYLLKIFHRSVAKSTRRILKIREEWGIRVIYSNWRTAALWQGQTSPAPRGHFWADPFLYAHQGKTYCFVEDYVYETRRGHISALEITKQGTQLIGTALKEDFHLSFPFLFQYQRELYMCPEASESQQIRIYKSLDFPLKWELCSIAMDNISAADSMFVEHRGRWWLFTNIDRSTLSDHCSELCLFYADSPLDSSWTAHPMNPIRIDATGRNAGLILENGRIFRAAQRQGYDQYGKGLVLYEIMKLTESDYDERALTTISRDYDTGALGTHHISTVGEMTVVDNQRRYFMP